MRSHWRVAVIQGEGGVGGGGFEERRRPRSARTRRISEWSHRVQELDYPPGYLLGSETFSLCVAALENMLAGLPQIFFLLFLCGNLRPVSIYDLLFSWLKLELASFANSHLSATQMRTDVCTDVRAHSCIAGARCAHQRVFVQTLQDLHTGRGSSFRGISGCPATF